MDIKKVLHLPGAHCDVTSFWQVIEKSRIEFRVRARAETNRNFGHAMPRNISSEIF